MLVMSCGSAVWLPKAASSRCTSSTQKWNTYTAWAAISPRYRGSCSQRLAKIRLGRGRWGELRLWRGLGLAMKSGGGCRARLSICAAAGTPARAPVYVASDQLIRNLDDLLDNNLLAHHP